MPEVVDSSILWTKALKKNYGSRQVVCGVDISITSGSVIGLLGPNGAGKTTTFYMVVGLAQPDGGQVFLGDEEITSLPMSQAVCPPVFTPLLLPSVNR